MVSSTWPRQVGAYSTVGRHVRYRASAGWTFSTCGRPTISNFSAGMRTPCAAYRRWPPARRRNLVVHRVRRVVRRRLVGVPVTEIDVGELLDSDERPVAGGCIDVEGRPQRRHDQRVQVSDAAGLDHRHVGQLGERRGRRRVPRDDEKPQPGPLAGTAATSVTWYDASSGREV